MLTALIAELDVRRNADGCRCDCSMPHRRLLDSPILFIDRMMSAVSFSMSIGQLPASYRAGGHFHRDVQWRIISADYFRDLQIPLVTGRFLSEQEPRGTVPISQLWPAGSGLAKTLLVKRFSLPWISSRRIKKIARTRRGSICHHCRANNLSSDGSPTLEPGPV